MIPKSITKDSEMFIGEHKGKKISEVPATELIWRLEVGKAYGPLKTYILANLKELKEKAKEENK